MKHWRYDPYDNQGGEIEYFDEPIPSRLITTGAKMLEIKEL